MDDSFKSKLIFIDEKESDYNSYKNKFKEISNKIEDNKKNESIKKALISINDKKLFFEYVFFKNHINWTFVNFEHNNKNIDSKNIKTFLEKIKKINDEVISNSESLFSIIIRWLYYLYYKFIKNLSFTFKINFGEINRIRYLLTETSNIIIILYNEKIFSSSQILELNYFWLFLINNNLEVNCFSDSIISIKNYILFQGLFSLLKENLTVIFLEDKKNIGKLFTFLDDFRNSSEINTPMNKIILIKNNSITSFMTKLLDKIENPDDIEKFQPDFQNKLLFFFSHFFKNKFRMSELFDRIINSLKNSYSNLYHFVEQIIKHDLFVQSFYIKLLNKIFFDKENKSNDSLPTFNTFLYNGYDSKISINVRDNNFEKSTLFLSFCILPKKGQNKYPLLIIEKDYDKKIEILFSLFFKRNDCESKTEKEYDLYYLYKNEEKIIRLGENIKSYKTFYLGITFNPNKIWINLIGENGINFTEIEKPPKLFAPDSLSFVFGHEKKISNVFSGHIGPIIIIKNPKWMKENKLLELICSILSLKNNYQYFIYIQCNTVNNFDYFKIFKGNDIIKFHNKNEKNDNIDCLLYLTPDILRFLNIKSNKEQYQLPNVPNICEIQRQYSFKINITLAKYENDKVNFLIDNGLSYISLLYEYLYQFIKNFLVNIDEDNETKQDKKVNDKIIKTIVDIFKETLFFIKNNNYEISVNNFSKSNKHIFLTLFSCAKLLRQNYYIIDELSNYILDIIFFYKSYIVNSLNQKNKKVVMKGDKNTSEGTSKELICKNNEDLLITYIAFRNSLIDFLLTPDLYSSNDKKTIISLFEKINGFFDKEEYKEVSLINNHFFDKILSFNDLLSGCFSEFEDSENDKLLKAFFNLLINFFSSNKPNSKNYFTTLFKFIIETNSDNFQIITSYFNFINNSLQENLNCYFNEADIKSIIKYSQKLIDKENDINKNKHLQIIIHILIKIIFSKERITKKKEENSENESMIEQFHNFFIKIQITDELIVIITDELKKLIYNSLLGENNEICTTTANENKNNKKDKKANEYLMYNDLKDISDYYSQIFDFIFYLIDYYYTKKNINNNNSFDKNNIYENKIIELLLSIENLIKVDIEIINNLSQDNKEEDFSIDSIYCLINFIKFYYIISFNNNLFLFFFNEKYIINFINLCNICFSSCLIYSNILIDIDTNNNKLPISKTLIEIILDICIYLLIYSFDDLKNKNNTNIKNIEECQEIIYSFVEKNIWNWYDEKKKNEKQQYTIFYINDYLRQLSTLYSQNRKKFDNDDFYIYNMSYFKHFPSVIKLLFNEKKFVFNFTTFFLYKINVYKFKIQGIINESFEKNNRIKRAKINELLILLIRISQGLLTESEILIKKNKDFYYKSNKLSTSYEEYNDMKNLIEKYIRNHDIPEAENLIKYSVFKKNIEYEKIHLFIYSGLCKVDTIRRSFISFNNLFSIKKINNNSENSESQNDDGLPKSFKKDIHTLSTDNLLLNQSNENLKIPRVLSGKVNTNTPLLRSDSKKDNYFDSSSQSIDSKNEEDDLELNVQEEEVPTSISVSYNLNNIVSTPGSQKNIITSSFALSPVLKSKTNLRTDSNVSFDSTIKAFCKNDNNNLSFKNKIERKESSLSYITSDTNEIFSNVNHLKHIPHLCCYEDAYINSPKKELMMKAFSIYFFDAFFNNEIFETMKDFYLQNFSGINESSKLLDYPTKMKNYKNGLEPPLFLKPNINFFESKTFPITHSYFYNEMIANIKDSKKYEPIILYKKDLPPINVDKKNDFNCELIQIEHDFYGHIMIIDTKYNNLMIFEETNFNVFNDIEMKNCNKKIFDDLFSISILTKKPLSERQQNILDKAKKKVLGHKEKYYHKKTVIILFSEIEEIIERRFLFMWQAIEIYLKNGHSYFFNFLTEAKSQEILNIFKNNNETKDKIYERDFFKKQKLITQEWQEGRLTTYEYLLIINKYSSRTYNDANQYPIFPWLIRKYNINDGKENKIYRDFKYPIGAQTDETKETAMRRYIDDEETGFKNPSHFGTHYSTSSYIYFYLMREEPYTKLLIKLQNYCQENADRMFTGINDTLFILECGNDHRESIPELFSKIEHFINLNCSDFGCKTSKIRVDDFLMDIFDNKNNSENNSINSKSLNKEISNYVKFIINNKSLLNNDESIVSKIIYWIDNVFGVNQIPNSKLIKTCYNIFNKESYAQKVNLSKKLAKYLDKQKSDEKMTNEEIMKKIVNKITYIISFGQTPYQIFDSIHPKIGKKFQEQNEEGDIDFFSESLYKETKLIIEKNNIFFEINTSQNRIYLFDKSRKITIVDTLLFEKEYTEKYELKKYYDLSLPHIKLFNKSRYQNDSDDCYYHLKPIYSFSSFPAMPNSLSTKMTQKQILNSQENNKVNYHICNDNDLDYVSYYKLLIDEITLSKSRSRANSKSRRKSTRFMEDSYLRFITCRYIDNTFKIYQIPKEKSGMKKDDMNLCQPLSYLCEDFVNCCCAITYKKFVVGLKNGKLLEWFINNNSPNNKDEDSSRNKNRNSELKIVFNKQFQAHIGGINIIEVNHRLGIIITAGDDNFVFIRKLYDYELLTPIKIKWKYVVTMAKVSDMNLLYLMCFNKLNHKSVILGYTLNGLKFAKSNYGLYCNLDFTKSGNIVSLIYQKRISILSGENLTEIPKNDGKSNIKYKKLQSQIVGSTWLQYRYFNKINEGDIDYNKIVVFTNSGKDKNKENNLVTIDVKDITYFD